MRIRLSDERRSNLLRALQGYFEENFDEPLSAFRAEGLISFLLLEMGPTVYNQGVRDACAAMQEKLLDLEGEVYEQESR